jgi:hypothetical protein
MTIRINVREQEKVSLLFRKQEADVSFFDFLHIDYHNSNHHKFLYSFHNTHSSTPRTEFDFSQVSEEPQIPEKKEFSVFTSEGSEIIRLSAKTNSSDVTSIPSSSDDSFECR